MHNPMVRKDDRAIGKAVRHAFYALAFAGAAAATQAQSQWNPIYQGLPLNPDPSWGVAEEYRPHPSRLASDARGNLFISLKESLYMRKPGAQTWNAVARTTLGSPYQAVPLAVGGEGQVLWGEWTSRNWGETWSIMPRNGIYGMFAIGPQGIGLLASSATILRSVSGGTEWAHVYGTDSFDDFHGIAVSPSGWALATTASGDGLISRDTGSTWAPLNSIVSGPRFKGGFGPMISTTEKGYGTESFWTTLHTSQGGKVTCVEFRRQGDSLVVHSPANLGFPDSAVTALQSQSISAYGSLLWLGTWGQGVYISRDHGATWERFNGGLRDLHVETIMVTPPGTAYILTKDGMFSNSAFAATAIQKNTAGSRRNGNGTGSLEAVPLFGNAAGRFFRIDGRIPDSNPTRETP